MRQDDLQRMEASARQRRTAGELTLAEKKEFIRAVVEMVTVHSEGRLDIEGIVPTNTAMVTAGGQLNI